MSGSYQPIAINHHTIAFGVHTIAIELLMCQFHLVISEYIDYFDVGRN